MARRVELTLTIRAKYVTPETVDPTVNVVVPETHTVQFYSRQGGVSYGLLDASQTELQVPVASTGSSRRLLLAAASDNDILIDTDRISTNSYTITAPTAAVGGFIFVEGETEAQYESYIEGSSLVDPLAI